MPLSVEDRAAELLRMLGGSPLPEAVQRTVLRRLLEAEDKVIELQRQLHDIEPTRAAFMEQAAKLERMTSTAILLECEAARLRHNLRMAEQVIPDLRSLLDTTQQALRRYMSTDGGCDCLQCDEEPSRTICCESCIYCHARYALGEAD